MHISDHPLYKEFSEAFNRMKDAHDRVVVELQKGDRGLSEAAKLDLMKAQEGYDAVCSKL